MTRVAIADASSLIYSDDYRDGWPWGFERIGCEVKVFDIAHLARSRSARSPYSSRGWMKKGQEVARRIIQWNPDLVWCHHGRHASSDETFLQKLKDHRIPTAVYLCDEPYEVGETIFYGAKYSHVFTMDPCTVATHAKQRLSKTVWYLPPAVNDERFKTLKWKKRNIPALFLGNASLVPRIEFLKPVEAAVPGTKICYWHTVRKQQKDWIPLEDYPALYSRSKIGLNVHRDPSITKECYVDRVKRRRSPFPNGIEACKNPPTRWGTGFWNDLDLPAAHINPRFFEMAASGCCVISDDDRPELRRMFPMAPRAQDAAHFLELVQYYLEHEDEAEEVGLLCSYLISKRHTYRHRAAEVLIRVGLREPSEVNRFSSLGEPEDWLTTQDFDEHGVLRSLERTGPCERFDPRSGKFQMARSGTPSATGLISLRPPWSS